MTNTQTATDECTWLCDYCAQCAAGPECSRLDAVVEPEEIEWPGGAVVVARYRCGCGHEWTCRWSADHLTAPSVHAAKGS